MAKREVTDAEQLLSKWGFRLYLAVAMVLMAYVIWGTFADSGIPAWLNELQARTIYDGKYSIKLTIVLLLLPVLFIAFLVGFLYDYLSGQGYFAKQSENAPGCRTRTLDPWTSFLKQFP